MKRKRMMAAFLAIAFILIALTGCEGPEKVPVEKDLDQLAPLNGSVLEQTLDIPGETFKLVTTYNTGRYNLSKWRITDSKSITMNAWIENLPAGTTVLVEHVHIDMSLKATQPQVDGLMQDTMDDSYHGYSQDGFFIDENYKYQNIFAVEGFSETLISGWGFVCGSYGNMNISEDRLTERNLTKYGEVYANKMQVVYDLLIKNEGEEYFHSASVMGEFLIPICVEDETNS